LRSSIALNENTNCRRTCSTHYNNSHSSKWGAGSRRQKLVHLLDARQDFEVISVLLVLVGIILKADDLGLEARTMPIVGSSMPLHLTKQLSYASTPLLTQKPVILKVNDLASHDVRLDLGISN
jgi:hypothetical protein